ncbi:LuxR C-terminal-related transcriptional regulator [Kutzneria albida]|uniref:HTH luxR-type domain-containing protein n=1 Tax=Kutzneria albida DSM 43870 TaxID=1449976 RepID=W5WA45_9PSEU|nr:LuxR C-terminal-related transcriptional regulator [Kutzneria albida]AHH97792.1 hypothetical protein KALB_4430 [Kutzneria albida DSM 43870]
MQDLGDEFSARTHRLIPHDTYMLIGLDPLSGGVCLHAEREGYRPEVRGAIEREAAALGGLSALGAVRVLTPGEDLARLPVRGRFMIEHGFTSELRVSLVEHGEVRGALVLVRGGGRPFSPREQELALEVSASLAVELRRYVTGLPMSPVRLGEWHSGVAVIGSDDTIRTITPSLRAILGSSWGAPVPDEVLFGSLSNTTYLARRSTGPVLTRLPSASGWIAMGGERIAGGEVVLTVVSPTAELLLPAIAAWYGITARERSVLEAALEGERPRGIARRFGLSPHTVNDHLKSIYRKTGVSGREELMASLSP